MAFELERLAKKYDETYQGFEIERIASAMGATLTGFEIEQIADSSLTPGDGDVDVSMYKAVIEGTITHFEGDIRSVRSNAFANCSSLTTVNLPLTTSIGMYAFYECSSLTKASLPSVTKIYEGAFTKCQSLSAVYMFGNTVPEIILDEDVAFDYTGNPPKFYVKASMYDAFLSASIWSDYGESRFISMTDAEIDMLDALN